MTVTAILSFAAFVERPWVSLYSLLSILAGIPVYYFWLRPQSQAVS
jgi:APA family basic amino acid/polyamine antiporter